jgi:copper homeostasis protein
MKFVLEVIGYSIEDCIEAQKAGADRIELCANPNEGGTTPSYGFIKAAREKLNIRLYTMIRPRGGDFYYTDDEFDIMKDDISVGKQLGCDGIVIGALTSKGKVDKIRISALIKHAYPLEVTFHRAFDEAADPFEALEDIIELGCERILTSGQQPTAIEGADIIKQLIKKADERIIVMPGSGVRANNIIEMVNKTGATEFHTSARRAHRGKSQSNSMTNNNAETTSLDSNEIKKIIQQLTVLPNI